MASLEKSNNKIRVLLVVYDNESYIHWFPIGLGYIAAILKKYGYEVTIYNQDKNHYDEKHLTEYLDNNLFDFIGVSVVGGYYQYHKLLKISEAINTSKNRPYYIIGGHGPSPEPKYFIEKSKADAIVIGEGEETIIELLDAIINKKNLAQVKGIAYAQDGQVKINERRPLIKDIDSLPYPAYELFPMEYYRLLRMPHATSRDFVIPILSGRGCTFKCNFCYRMDEGFRPHSAQRIIDEIKYLKKEFGATYIVFADELLMSSVERATNLCQAIIDANLNIKWNCNGRLNYAEPELLNLMKKSGCVFINYGIESMDEKALKTMNKCLTVKQIINGIENTLAAGISPGYNIIFGNIGENAESLRLGVEFLLKYDDHSQLRTIRPVTPYPGSPLYYYAIDKGLLKDCADFYENKHTNSDLMSINFTDMSEEEYYKELCDANLKLIDKYYKDKSEDIKKQTIDLYSKRDSSFRGFRQD